MSVDRLLAQHIRILDSAAAIERLAAGPRPDEVGQLSRERWAFTRDLLLHFAQIDSGLYAHLLADPRPDIAREAGEATAETARLVEDFQHHAQRWRGLPAAEDWQDYRSAAAALMRRVRDRLDGEARLIARALPLSCAGRPAQRTNRYAAHAWEIRRLIFANNRPIA